MFARGAFLFRRSGWAWLLLLPVLAAVAFVALAGGGARRAGVDPAAAHAFDLRVCVAPQRTGDRPELLLASPARFDCGRSMAEWGPGDYWLRLVPADLSAAAVFRAGGKPPTLRLLPQWQRGLFIYVRDETGRLMAQPLDPGRTIRVGIGGAIGVPLQIAAGEPILLRSDGALNAAGLVGAPQLVEDHELDRQELVATAIFAGFAGLGVGLLCYNLVLWLTIRERFQLTYCLSLMAMLAYVWSSSGTMVVQFPGTKHTDRLATSYLMLAFVAALALQFITDFIEPGKLPERLRLLARQTGLGSIAAALAVGMVPDGWRYVVDRIYVASFVPLPPLVAVMTFIAWRRHSGAIRVLAVAWTVPLVMAVVRIAHALNLIEDSLLVQYAPVTAMSIEALLSSMAMSLRIRLITEDRDQARADERAARHLANVDSLTGLLNRRALLEQIIDWGSPEPLRLLIVDIDHFKQINDRHGHLVGDEVLREVAEVLAIRADLRATVARLGGEEFALVGTADELQDGIALGILADMRARPMAGHVNLTVSIGIADGMVTCEDDWRDLYHRADEALYVAKGEGRNRVVFGVEPPTALTVVAA